MKIGNNWVAYNADNVKALGQMPSNSIHLTITSLPFADLYTYSDDERDLSNVSSLEEYFEQLDYLIPELYRVTIPNRVICLHVKQLATFKERDGKMGLIDFRGMMIRAFQKHNWTFHGEITIWTDPQREAIRTKSATILNKSFRTNAEITRTGMADYIIIMRKVSDEGGIKITHDDSKETFELWTRLASPVWGLSDITPKINRQNVLNYAIAKIDKDEKHMTPLQLDLIENLIIWYSNENEIVLDPCAGVMSVPYQAVKTNRKGVGIELKESNYNTGCNFLKEIEKKDYNLFDLLIEEEEGKNHD